MSTNEQADHFLSAVRDGNKELAAELLETFPDLRRYSVQTAAAACDATALAALLKAGASVSGKESEYDPLVYLCRSPLFSPDARTAAESVTCAKLLLDAGASPNTQVPLDGESGGAISILYFACVGNNIGLVRELLERGANPNDSESIYHSAEMNHRECLELLVQHGGDTSGACDFGLCSNAPPGAREISTSSVWNRKDFGRRTA